MKLPSFGAYLIERHSLMLRSMARGMGNTESRCDCLNHRPAMIGVCAFRDYLMVTGGVFVIEDNPVPRGLAKGFAFRPAVPPSAIGDFAAP